MAALLDQSGSPLLDQAGNPLLDQAGVSAPVFDAAPSAPAFPAAFLNMVTEVQLNGTWTDISPYVFMNSTSIGRGHPDESTTAAPSSFTATLNNSDGRFSQLNPSGPYYPFLGLNTPIRVSIPEGATYLRLENDTASYVQGPAYTGFSGGMQIQIDMTPDNWLAPMILAGQYVSTGNQRSWVFGIVGGYLFFGLSTDGVNVSYAYCPYALDSAGRGGNIQVNPHQRLSVYAIYNVASQTVTFYYGSYLAGWVVIGSAPLTGVPYASTAPVQAGNCPVNDVSALAPSGGSVAYTGVTGKVHAFVAASISGTTLTSPDFTAQTAGAASFTDAQGVSWTLGGAAEISARRYRFHGTVSAWPQTWTPNGANAVVALAAGGPLRRMGQGSPPSLSPMYRYYTAQNAPAAAAYWPMEDASGVRSLASATGGFPMTWTGSPALASNSTFAGSGSLPVLNGATLTGKVSYPGTWTANDIRFLMNIPAAGDTSSCYLINVYTTGTVALLQLYYTTSLGGSLNLYGYNVAGTQVISEVLPGGLVGYDGYPSCVQIALTQSGGNVVATMNVATVGSNGVTAVNTANASTAGTVGAVTGVQVNPPVNTGNLLTTAVGHLAVLPTYRSIASLSPYQCPTVPGAPFSGTFTGPMNGWTGEPAGARFGRLTAEQGLQFRGAGNMADTVAMGTQAPGAATDLLQACADADRGAWFEPRQCLGFGYRSRASIGNQLPWITFDYGQDHLSDSLQPTHDDQTVSNDVTVTNDSTGSTARAVLNDGSPMSIGVIGNYSSAASAYLASDSQLADHVGWRLHAATVNEPRYTAVSCDLANVTPSLVALYYLVLDADIGDRINVVNPPAWLPPGVIDQVIQGGTETISLKDLNESWNGVPATPYNVAYLDDPVYGRCDTDGSVLAVADLTGTATSLSVTTAGALSPLWTTNAADFPFNVIVAGEVMTVTNITGTASPQAFTVVRSVNGIVKPQAAGADVRLAIQPTLSL